MKEFYTENKIENLIDTSIEKIRTLIENKTIVGDPLVAPDGTIIIPISKVSVGFIVGGGEFSDKTIRSKSSNYPMAGGSGGGMSVSPVGFLVETNNTYKFIDIEDKSTYQTFLNLFNTLLNKLGESDEKDR